MILDAVFNMQTTVNVLEISLNVKLLIEHKADIVRIIREGKVEEWVTITILIPAFCDEERDQFSDIYNASSDEIKKLSKDVRAACDDKNLEFNLEA